MTTNRVREYRNKQNMTQFELAKKSNITPGDISQMETGKKYPFPNWRKRLSEALEIEEKVLFPNIDEE